VTTPLTHTLPEAARLLGGAFTIDWLKGHIDEIPHGKVGNGTGRAGRIYFTDAHLQRILLMFAVEPQAGTTPGDFTPLTRRRSA
jgi:hypothetical protein